VFVVCASGNRSKAGTDVLRRAGRDAVSVRGGTKGWAEAGHPVTSGARP
jgi:rhodanese-related sulfurtransferase